ncbi:peroxiredoxin-2 [Chelonoidis abingdonii]
MASGKAQVGKPAPGFHATAVVDGAFKEIKLSDYEGERRAEGSAISLSQTLVPLLPPPQSEHCLRSFDLISNLDVCLVVWGGRRGEESGRTSCPSAPDAASQQMSGTRWGGAGAHLPAAGWALPQVPPEWEMVPDALRPVLWLHLVGSQCWGQIWIWGSPWLGLGVYHSVGLTPLSPGRVNTPRKEGGLGTINIPLLSDLTHSMAADYGVLKEDEGLTYRGLFIIDDKGILRQITINDLPVGRSVEEVLRLVQAFQYTDTHGEVCPAGWQPGSDTIKPTVKDSKEYFTKQH